MLNPQREQHFQISFSVCNSNQNPLMNTLVLHQYIQNSKHCASQLMKAHIHCRQCRMAKGFFHCGKASLLCCTLGDNYIDTD